MPLPKCKVLNGEVCKPTSDRAKEKAAEAAAERESALQELLKKHHAARAQVLEDYPDFGKYAFEVRCAPQLRAKESAAKAVVHGLILKAMGNVRKRARERDTTIAYLNKIDIAKRRRTIEEGPEWL